MLRVRSFLVYDFMGTNARSLDRTWDVRMYCLHLRAVNLLISREMVHSAKESVCLYGKEVFFFFFFLAL